MTIEEVAHLSKLARVKLTDKEAEVFTTEISEILEYVSQIQSLTETDEDDTTTPELGARYNVFREDVVTNEPDAFSEDLIKEMPDKEGRYLKVKKILQIDTD